MPTFNGFRINASATPGGIIFELTDAPIFDRIIAHCEGELHLRAGNHRGFFGLKVVGNAERPDDLFARAYHAANEALDILSVQWRDSILIKNPSRHTHWYPTAKGLKVSVQSFVRFGGAGHAQAQVKGLDGSILSSSPQPLPAVQNAFRYFRYAQASASVLDAYHNMFLALEWMLDDIYPVQPTHGTNASGTGPQANAPLGETEWLQEALRQGIQRHQINIDDWKASPTADPVDSFVRHHYNRIRCGVFHAKGSRGRTFLPGDLVVNDMLRSELERIQKIVEELMRQRCGAYFASSGIGHSGLLAHLKSYGTHVSLAIFEDDSATLNSRTEPPSNVVNLPVTYCEPSSAEPSDAGHFLTDIRCADYSLARVGTAALVGPRIEGLAVARQINEILIENVDLMGVAKLEFVVRCQLENLMARRLLFDR